MTNKKFLFTLLFVFFIGIILVGILLLNSDKIAMLNPKGLIALRERDLMITAISLMLIVVIPVFVLTIAISWRYRAGNKEAEYAPNWDHNFLAESIWWGLPFAIILILSIITWKSSHELDPFKPLDAKVSPLKIQVVALQWKWLFIYPEQKIATVNFVQFPKETPINFELTADAPMNSFWIPELGGQIYAMPAMKTKLHLIANEIGSFRGSSANISGKGFSGMTFIAQSTSRDDFEQWVKSVKQSPNKLNLMGYQQLAEPSEYQPTASFLLEKEDLFDWVVMKPMTPIRYMQN